MCHGRNSDESIFAGVRIRKVALVCVRHPFPARPKLISPYKWLASEPAARRKLPFGLGRQTLAGPFCVRYRVVVSNLDNRIIPPAHNTAFRSAWMAPIGTLHVRPPLKMIVERHGMVRRGKNNAPCHKILRWSPGKILRARYALGHSHIAGRLYELRELRVGHVRLVYVEAVYIDAVNGTSIKGGFHADIIHVRRIVLSHRKFA